ncbi:MAG: hypothetical protein SZ59_C0001G0194 [candidate division TM6 bacterium GW2011_GWF2_28_16]|nr:MAG: hypothetical protein SZ59_C0001G0194 [candidate division TM6 bacterium GW2011_GWF2_28_16]
MKKTNILYLSLLLATICNTSKATSTYDTMWAEFDNWMEESARRTQEFLKELRANVQENTKELRQNIKENAQEFKENAKHKARKFKETVNDNVSNINTKFFSTNKQENAIIGSTNIFESKDSKKWGIEINLPGYKKDEVKVKIERHGFLTVTAESKQELIDKKEDKDKKYIYKSQSFCSKAFARTIKLPKNVDYKNAKNIETSYDEKTGILEVKFNKIQEEQAKPDVIELELK